jgi:signal transduction histidine kinase
MHELGPQSLVHSDEDALRGVDSDCLRQAVFRISDAWAKSLKGGVGRDEVVQVLGGIARRIEALVLGESEVNYQGDGKCLLQRQLAELLRLDLLEHSTPDSAEGSGDPAEVLQLLRSLEQVRSNLEPNRGQDFADRLLQPDAFELIVEVAHDLRSPLTSILFLSETIRRGHSGEVNELQHRQLGLVYSAALGLISIASDIMELARGGTRLSDEAAQPFSVGEVLQSIREMVQIMADEKNITLRLMQPEGDRCLGYPVALSRTLLNLTTNALKFTDEGLVEVTARRLNRKDVEFSVRDTGRGIAPVAQETLFEPFQKARERSGHFFSGSGLGLSIARRLVDAMGSTLEYETRPGWGTRFHFTVELPTADEL